MITRKRLKQLAGDLPFTAELYWLLRNREGKAFSRFNLETLKKRLPRMVAEVEASGEKTATGRKVFIFAATHFWLNHAMATSLALRGLGHQVTLGYLPFSDFEKEIPSFDLRRNDLYAQAVLRPAEGLVTILPMLGVPAAAELPEALELAVEGITTFDTRYILQREEVSGVESIHLLRRERNQDAARRALALFSRERPEVVVLPNGMIQEYGAIYETARSLGIRTVTYEFGEQDQRIWLGQDRWVIHHIIDELWNERRERKLDEDQRAWLETFLAGRQRLSTGSQFAHLWQKADRTGGTQVRRSLGLDERPVVLLPTNVLGDSATLGLTVFTRSMTEWLERVLPILAGRTDLQVVIRIHPGETLTVGPSVMEIIQRVLPELPAQVRVISATEKVNTYDLMEITDLALVYTTTAGLEMAVRGIPVVVSGKAHYRGRGFTLEAQTWDEYVSTLTAALASMPARLGESQVEKAWNYAYTFFAEYPRPFPWHLERLWSSLDERPLAYVLGPEGRARYAATFQQLAGMPAGGKTGS